MTKTFTESLGNLLVDVKREAAHYPTNTVWTQLVDSAARAFEYALIQEHGFDHSYHFLKNGDLELTLNFSKPLTMIFSGSKC